MPTSRIKLVPLLLLVILQTHLKISNGFADLGLKTQKSGEIDAIAGRICQGKFGNCPTSMSEFEEVDSEAPKRRSVLAGERRYISYETLRRDLVPCSTPGSSYYHCGAAPANHYTRGCSRITQCARF